ncbi:MAG: hypothetical protein GX638_00480 [Crenarchaeota archaeon]|nr:hypothetical protein [Thermoproteota archaeon]
MKRNGSTRFISKKCEDCGLDLGLVYAQKRYCKKCAMKRRSESIRQAMKKAYNAQKRLKIGILIKGECNTCQKKFEYIYQGGSKRKKCDNCGYIQRMYANRKLSYIEQVKQENKLLKEKLLDFDNRIINLEKEIKRLKGE